MRDQEFQKTAGEICRRDRRYHIDSYTFIREALEFTAKMLDKPERGEGERHVTGRELLEGLRNYATEEFGPLARTVLASWGITRTEDFGNLVFNLVEAGVLRKTDQDTAADFADGYDFEEAFLRPYQARTPPRPTAPKEGGTPGDS